MTLHIAICDDERAQTEYLKTLIAAWSETSGNTVHCTAFPSAEAFWFRYAEDAGWDILLLDIEMGEMDGVSLAKRIRAQDSRVQILFVTGFPDFMAEGYEVSALHYLLKPVSAEKLSAVLDRAAANLQKTEKRLCIPWERQTVYVPLSDICYVEAQKQYVVIHTKTAEYRTKGSLSDTEAALDEYFIRCQRSFLVNLLEVTRIRADCVVLKNGAAVPISRGMAETIGKEMIRLF